MERVKYILNIVIIALLFVAIAIQRDGRVVGRDVNESASGEQAEQQVQGEDIVPVEQLLEDGTRVIYSLSLAKDIIGYGGHTPVRLFVKDGVIDSVEAEPNAETRSFFDQVVNSGLLDSWCGMTLVEAASAPIDGVSGATYTAEAIIGNVKRAAQYGAEVTAMAESPFKDLGAREFVALLVVLLGVVITLAKWRNKWLILLQMVLNVAVLGFWCGSFLSLSTFVAWAANGVNLSLSLIPVVLLVVTLVMPLLGRKGSYCHIHCPMGAAQEIVGRAPIKKYKMNSKLAKALGQVRYYLLMLLLFMMWVGVGFELIDYEVFSAFIISSASNFVLVMAVLFLVLSLFTPRPYCRFVCPTGALITISQKSGR